MKRHFFLLALFLHTVCTLNAEAQQYRYMDSSGNIHFTDHIGTIPKKYIHQIIPPTPVPRLTREDVARVKREQQAAERDQIVKDREAKTKAKLRQVEIDKRTRQLKAEEHQAREALRLQRME